MTRPAFSLHANVVRLLLGELGEAGTQSWQVQRCHLLIQLPKRSRFHQVSQMRVSLTQNSLDYARN